MTTPHDATGSEPGDVTQRKAAARATIRAGRREQLSRGGPAGRQDDAAALVEHGLAWLAEHERRSGGRVRCVTAYEEMASEPPISALVQALTARGVRVLVPLTLPDGVLRWRVAQPGRHDNPMLAQRGDATTSHLSESDESWGSDILSAVDLAFIPALALGPQGTRLGQGGGYYDRAIPALRTMRPDVPVVAVVYSNEVGQDVPARDHDIRVDAALTPGGLEHLTEMSADHTPDANA